MIDNIAEDNDEEEVEIHEIVEALEEKLAKGHEIEETVEEPIAASTPTKKTHTKKKKKTMIK